MKVSCTLYFALVGITVASPLLKSQDAAVQIRQDTVEKVQTNSLNPYSKHYQNYVINAPTKVNAIKTDNPGDDGDDSSDDGDVTAYSSITNPRSDVQSEDRSASKFLKRLLDDPLGGGGGNGGGGGGGDRNGGGGGGDRNGGGGGRNGGGGGRNGGDRNGRGGIGRDGNGN